MNMIWSEYNACLLTEPAVASWGIPPAVINCTAREIHLWRVPLELPDARLDAFTATFSPDECARVDGFLLPRPRRRFIVGRGALRDILARYLHIAPAQVLITAAAQGKPVLTASEDQELHFNIAHAHDYVLIGIARRSIGIDLEYLRDNLDLSDIARQNFSSEQIEYLASKKTDELQHLFFQYWTRLEAYLKALGIGFTGKTDHPQTTPHCCSFIPMPRYLAAVAIEGTCDEMKYWDFI